MSSSDEFYYPFSEDTGGGLLETEGGTNIQGAPVVLLHGLWRGWRSMEPLAREIGSAGFSTLNLPYPSTRLSVDRLVERIRLQIGTLVGNQPVHIVAHSLGGIIARVLAAETPPLQIGRLVMLAPPNNGSEIVDWSANHPAIRRILGPAGISLGTGGLPSRLPAIPPEIEAAVIMGNKPAVRYFRKLLEPENDGIVSVAGGRIAGLRGFAIVDADHTFIQTHPGAIQRILPFLESGHWAD